MVAVTKTDTKKRGRPSLGNSPMTPAERKRRQREVDRQKLESFSDPYDNYNLSDGALFDELKRTYFSGERERFYNVYLQLECRYDERLNAERNKNWRI
tara:strand:+ start:1154 stop:1447 length:294 start_codon:yes stop_codon:yes gene_type:complete